MRKAKLIFAAGLMVMSLFTGVAFNGRTADAAGAVECEISSAEGYRGDTVKVTVKVTSNPGTIMSQNTFSYDSNVVEVTKVENLDLLTNDETVGQSSAWTAPNLKKNPIGLVNGYEVVQSNSTKTGDMYVIELKIKEDAAIGESTINFGGTFCDWEFNDYNVNCKDATIKVLCKHEDTEEEILSNPTCTDAGKKNVKCKICGEIVSTDEIPATGHSFGEWSVVTAPNCTEKGTEKRVCSVCKTEETRDVEALGHNVEKWTVNKEATCTEAGEEQGSCKVCGNIETREIKALGHKLGEWTIEKEATAKEEGLKTSKCEVCGEKFEQLIPKLTEKPDEGNNKPDEGSVKPDVSSKDDNNSNTDNNNGNINNSDKNDKTEKNVTQAANNNIDKKNEAVKTGDTSVALELIGLMAAAGAVVVAAKKRQSN